MKEHGILFTAPMVRAILAGTKTQTRRLAKAPRLRFLGGTCDDPNDPALWGFSDQDGCWHVLDQKAERWHGSGVPNMSYRIEAPHGPVGRRLWVRETWVALAPSQRLVERKDGVTFYREMADLVRDDSGEREGWWFGHRFIPGKARPFRWQPAIHMPRSRSRITIEVTGVRLERVQSITEDDARAEGCWIDEAEHGPCDDSARDVYADLWDKINGAGSWASNPWVWVYEFRRVS